MNDEQIKPGKLKDLIKDKAKELNNLLALAEARHLLVVIKVVKAISAENKAITGTKSILAITYPAQAS